VIALLVGVGVLILLLLGVRGCLDARKERGFENYLSDLDSIVAQSNQLSNDFFNRLENPQKGLTELQLEAQITTDRGTAEGLLQRAEGLDAPDEVADAQEELVQAFELRRDGLAGVAEDIPTALGNEGRSEAIARMVGDMQAFLASDVLYRRAQGEIDAATTEQEINGKASDSVFLPPPTSRWLDDSALTVTLNGFAAETGNVPPGVHGVELVSTTIDKTTLSPDFDNTVALGNEPPELTIGVQNGGDNEETDVIVSYALDGGSVALEGQAAIASIDAQGIAEATIPLESLPETDVALTLQIDVLPVLGETVIDNNAATYTVTFN
jgi:hypothetical protein